MTREIYNDKSANSGNIKKEIVAHIIEDYKENSDIDSTGELTTAQDGELIYGVRATMSEKNGKEEWYLEFQDGKKDGPYQQIEYDNKYIYCTIIFDLAYKYELNKLLTGVGSMLGYYAYVNKFIEEHKEEYLKYKQANYQMLKMCSKAQRFALAELDWRHQLKRSVEKPIHQKAYTEVLAK